MGIVFLFLFAGTLFGLYIAIRRAWSDTLTLGGVGTILNTVFVILYALLYQETSTAQAIVAGLAVGAGFSVAVVIIALFFRTNQPSADVRLVSRPPARPASYSQEENQDGTGHDRHQTPE